jgi:hypothetical protein
MLLDTSFVHLGRIGGQADSKSYCKLQITTPFPPVPITATTFVYANVCYWLSAYLSTAPIYRSATTGRGRGRDSRGMHGAERLRKRPVG